MHLKNNNDFITDKINKDEYLNYMKYVDETKDVNFQLNNLLQIRDFFQTQNQTFRKIRIDLNKMKDPERLRFSINLGSSDLKLFEEQKKTWF